jgi:hypothetical protein
MCASVSCALAGSIMHNAATKAENNLFIFIGLKLSDL